MEELGWQGIKKQSIELIESSREDVFALLGKSGGSPAKQGFFRENDCPKFF